MTSEEFLYYIENTNTTFSLIEGSLYCIYLHHLDGRMVYYDYSKHQVSSFFFNKFYLTEEESSYIKLKYID